MAAELSLEQMGSKLGVIDSKIDGFIAAYGKKAMDEKNHTDKEKEVAIKKAMDEKEHEKKEAKRAALEAAIKKAMEEPIDEKKEAAIKKAMSDYGHEDKDKKEAMDNNHDKDKMNNEHVAAIIADKKIDIDNKILQAAAMSNPAGLTALKLELHNGSFTASKKMYETMEKMLGKAIFQASVPTPAVTQAPPFFMAGAISPDAMDSSQLNASSNVMDFAKLSTKDLLEGKI